MHTEFGSDFHFINFPETPASPSVCEIYPGSELFFSGRSALFNLLQKGIDLYNWQCVYLPDYYCHEVDAFIQPLSINICYYNNGPYNTKQESDTIDKATNVFVHVNYFGFDAHPRLLLKNAFVIEDHTHDLTSEWALNSNAHYCFASLRKSLPLPAGGIVWSPQKLKLPDAPPEKSLSYTAAFMKLSAMLLKKTYLEAGSVAKDDFRNLFMNSECLFEKQETNGVLPLFMQKAAAKIPIQLLREHKIKNYRYLSAAINEKQLLWQQFQAKKVCPFGLILYFNEEQMRNAMKDYLLKNNIYPAILWPHQKEQAAKKFSGRILFIHCDIRYDENDMNVIAEIINNFQYAD